MDTTERHHKGRPTTVSSTMCFGLCSQCTDFLALECRHLLYSLSPFPDHRQTNRSMGFCLESRALEMCNRRLVASSNRSRHLLSRSRTPTLSLADSWWSLPLSNPFLSSSPDFARERKTQDAEKSAQRLDKKTATMRLWLHAEGGEIRYKS